MNARTQLLWSCVAALLLTSCDTIESNVPSWMGGADRVIKRAPGERIDVLFNQSKLTPDSEVANVPVEVPEQTNLANWPNHNAAMQVPHIGLTGLTHKKSAKIGDGNRFNYAGGPAPVVSAGVVVVMDAAGVISAHDESDISNRLWKNNDGVKDDVSDAAGGGLSIADDIVYATTGNGSVRAISLKDGKLKWQVKVGAPVRGAPAANASLVIVITADNQTLALDAATGTTRWTHRGIREGASYVSSVAPVIQEGTVISAYSSGEIFLLRAESGGVIWSDTLGSSIKTRASAIFSGIDADPIVGEGVVVAISAAGEIQASALANGRPLWQKKISGHNTPWSAGNMLYILSETHDIAALFKKDGSIRWAQSLAVSDPRDVTRDVTPTLYGPILAGNALLVFDNKGMLRAFKPQDGTPLETVELESGAITAPLIVNGALYVVTKDARLYRYY